MKRLMTLALVGLLALPQVAQAGDPASDGVEWRLADDGWGAAPAAVQAWQEPITRWAEVRRIDPLLFASVIWQESNGVSTAFNQRTWASGLAQVMPSDCGLRNARGVPYFQDRPTSWELRNDPELNLDWGSRLLADALTRADGDVEEAIRLYTGGHSAVPYISKLNAFRDAQRWEPITYTYSKKLLE